MKILNVSQIFQMTQESSFIGNLGFKSSNVMPYIEQEEETSRRRAIRFRKNGSLREIISIEIKVVLWEKKRNETCCARETCDGLSKVSDIYFKFFCR